MEISNEFQKIKVTKEGFELLIKRGAGWTSVTSPDNPLIMGESFDLRPTRIEKFSDSKLFLSGEKGVRDLQGESLTFYWTSNIEIGSEGWINFEIEIDSKKSFRLGQTKTSEPQILVKLPTSTVQESGAFIWDQVRINNPSEVGGITQSDFPGAYYYDPKLSCEFMFYLDWESLTWVGGDNILGFLGGRCGTKDILLKDARTPMIETYFGFWPRLEFLGDVFPQGKQKFSFYYLVKESAKVSSWERLDSYYGQVSTIVSQKKVNTQDEFSWEEKSKSLNKDLVNKKMSQIKTRKIFGLRAYANLKNFSSPNPENKVELMTQADVTWPLLYYTKLVDEVKIKNLNKSLIKTLTHFYQKNYMFFANWYPQDGEEKHQDYESWYFLENGLVKVGWISLILNEAKLKALFKKFADGLISIAESFSYLFPLFYNWKEKRVLGERKNFIANGLFAYGMVLAYFLFDERKYLLSAEKSLKTMNQLPLDFLFHEPQQLSFAALASFELFRLKKKKFYYEMTTNFLNQFLRMVYPYSDRQLLKFMGCDTAGMVRSFPSKIYPVLTHNPAFKENVESFVALLPLLRDARVARRIIHYFALMRFSNFYFFDHFQKNSDPISIPLESLPAHPASGSNHKGGGVGHAIYAGGEVYWMYLAFEALASCENPDFTIIYLDLLEPNSARYFPLGKKNFLVYNSSEQKLSSKVSFHYLKKGKYELIFAEKMLRLDSKSLEKGVEVELTSKQFVYLTLERII